MAWRIEGAAMSKRRATRRDILSLKAGQLARKSHWLSHAAPAIRQMRRPAWKSDIPVIQ
jgi:hypothetical protein